tara:strand:+ start:3230 stop:3886 length:657 start_codon:yes stop_codon:yes gene_type:complete
MSEIKQWYKESKNFNFRLVNTEVNPEFSIWKAWDKRSEPVTDPVGNEMKFPIRDGVLTNSKGEVKEVADLKFMPKKDFTTNFPNLSKNFRYVREIIVGESAYLYGFTKTANNKIVELCDTLSLSKQDPTKAEFQQGFDKGKSASEMYSMKVIKTGLDPVKINVDDQSPDTGGNREQEIIDAIKSVHGNKADEVRFVEIMKQNDITEERAKELFKTYKG